MGREVRKVPGNWQHPKDANGNYIPLYAGRDITTLQAEWDAEATGWNEAEYGSTYVKYAGERPSPDDYMPNWPEAERTHWQMYETVSEGTPISAVHATPEALAEELASVRKAWGGYGNYTYAQWLSMIRAGWAPSMFISPEHGVEDGVVFAARNYDERGAHA